MDKLASEHKNKATFILVNTRGIEDAASYKESKSLSDACVHGANRPPEEYGLKYIPHKTILDSSGKVLKNFEGVNLSEDIKGLV
mmetsp:Transcript_118082/g.252291  ORF Transcript_118082/g.252291 Transcript_118082/m.252291 type:complete len:84 (+) Transcript_118082:257-508(+)